MTRKKIPKRNRKQSAESPWPAPSKRRRDATNASGGKPEDHASDSKTENSSETNSVPARTVSSDMRLNRYIARSGICSRRDADVLISEGKVQVNGKLISEFGVRVQSGDEVLVNGKRISPADHEYILLNKPTDTITSTSDERGRKSVLDLISAADLKGIGLFPVGRLDRNTMGVLLLTNDGKLAHRLMHPSYEIEKYYRVKARTRLTKRDLDSLETGVELEDGMAAADQVARLEDKEQRTIALSIHEGRNRQIRRMFEAIGSDVSELERFRYAGLTTTGVRRGKWRRLTREEILKLYRLVKL